MFNGLTVLSLVLCVVLWVRSFSVCDAVGYASSPAKREHLKETEVFDDHGWFIVNREYILRNAVAVAHSYSHWSYARFLAPLLDPHGISPYGFVRQGAQNVWGIRPFIVGIRCWLVASLSVLLPVVWFANWRRRRRLRDFSICWRCRYDLTGNVSGVCPECGKPIKNVVQAK
jgi:hypothetical protein